MSIKIDPTLIETELAAAADIIRALKESGDVETISRPIDVWFYGDHDKIQLLSAKIAALGWDVIGVSPGKTEAALQVQRSQTVETAAIRALTVTALEIAAGAGVEYDGWGCSATGHQN